MSGNHITYREIETQLCTFIGGVTERGVCLCEFADRGGFEKIKTRVEKRNKAEMIRGGNDILNQLEDELKRYLDGSLREFSVALDLQGTPFQKEVWRQLLKIPYGETRSYGDIAKELGKPGAARAVGRANGENYVAIIVPCHRVIEAGGGLRGYGGGLDRKKYLLDLESRYAG
ncbi:MAG: methylated-DNA--[protein]-cysteine S-methyltransferase [bacterium]|nr:methylated-DNA--[protein]-cysteine S-methyltransferase [bacterium]